MSSDNYLESCDYHYNQDTEYFHHTKELICAPLKSDPSSQPKPLANSDLFSAPIALSCLECHTNGIILHVVFCIWVLLLIKILIFSHVAVLVIHSIVFPSSSQLYSLLRFVYPFPADGHLICSKFFAIMNKAACEHLHTGLCFEIFFHFSWAIIQELGGRDLCLCVYVCACHKYMLNLLRNCQIIF